MKITQVISDSNIGGAGVLLSLICEGLCKKFDTEVIIPRGSMLKRRLSSTGARVTELDINPDKSFSLADTLTLLRHFKLNPPNIIHTHASLSARLAGKLLGGCVCLSTRHCAKVREEARASFIKKAIYERLTDFTISTAKCATENLLSEGIKENKIRTIRNGVRALERLDEEEKKRLKSCLGIKDGEIILGVCSRLEPIKGHDLTLRAAARLYSKIKNIRLLIVGGGTEEENLKRQAARLGISEICRFVGFSENPTPYQNIFHVNINASRGTETSCLATSECMSLGIPTVASDFGGNKEQIKNGINGLLFRSDDFLSLEAALYRVLSENGLYETLSAGAKQSFDNEFSLSCMLKDYEALYNSLKY